uniref:Uncharacterized protein n=1 Tax=Odontella aurita TaxID=265563 RepID=A0A7S4JD07_9STRA|mmetsp:Transcript_44018/g.134069  ORF Transcript_44018/g.134069 Transcript_44018/m.134069 type:complete len:265 (+) Transcript_44018:39-833(+)
MLVGPLIRLSFLSRAIRFGGPSNLALEPALKMSDEAADADGGSFPAEQVDALRSKVSDLGTDLPASSSIPSVETGNRADIVTNVRLLGIFPTAQWQSDPTIPDFVSDCHNYRIGYYNVAECDVTDAAGTTTRLVLVINAGDGDCNTGYWGGAFESEGRHSVVARFESVGDTETAVEEESGGISGFVTYAEGEGDIGENERVLQFPQFKDPEEEDMEGVEYFSGLFPGTCRTQLEKIMGVLMGRLMQGREWRALPKSLRDYGNVI